MAKKTAKAATEKFDFSNSTKLIQKTAKSINTQVQAVVTEVAEDLKDNGAHLTQRVMAPVKKAYDKAYEKVSDRVNWEYLDVAKVAKDANDYTVKTAEEIVDGVMVSGAKWQNVAEKAINGGLKLAAKQQNMMFDTMEAVKGQLGKSSKRLKKFLYN